MNSEGGPVALPEDRAANGQPSPRYVIVTTAYNEAQNIQRVIESVMRQTTRPLRWVIVADGCTDGTVRIVRAYTDRLPFLELVELPGHLTHDFASKVRAFNEGVARLAGLSFEFIGNLDADVSFNPSYFAEILGKFAQNFQLGIGGGGICEWDGSEYRPRQFNTTSDVAGAIQLFRRDCYETIGGFLPMRHGGEDWAAQICARMAGWQVQTFPEAQVLHHRPLKGARSVLRCGFRQGRMDFAMGSHPVFEVVRLCRRLEFGLPALVFTVRLFGFLIGYFSPEKRVVSREFVQFLRGHEREKLQQYIRCLSCRESIRSE